MPTLTFFSHREVNPIGNRIKLEFGVCVCVFLASGYGWVTVMHEIPISIAQPLTSLPYPRTQEYYSSGPPGGLAREGSNEPIVSWF